MYSTNYLSTYPLCKKQLTAQHNVTVHRPGGQISFSKLFMIIICPLTFHILAFYNDWWSLIYSFNRPWSQSITIQMHAKLTTHSPHLCPPRGQKFFINFFWDIIHTHTYNIPAFGVVGSLVDVFQEEGWRMSAECAHFIWGVCTNRATNKLHVFN